jgi:DNA-binding response OmpR family regulator
VQPVTVLLVDDDDAQRARLAAQMADHFDRVLEAPSAELALYSCSTESVDVVATSTTLPGMGTDALCTELVRHGGPPVVAYGLPDSGSRRALWLDGGCADCMSGDEPLLVAARCRAAARRARRRIPRRATTSVNRPPSSRIVPGVLRWR